MNQTKNYADKRWMVFDSFPEKKDNVSTWYGVYRGVNFEIKNFSFGPIDPKIRWTHYLNIPIDDQFEKEWADKFWLKPRYYKMGSEREHLAYDYEDSPVGQLTWHGGCTWYSKESSEDDKVRRIKIGCDYQHYWDEGKTYSLDSVYQEVKETIDSLWTLLDGKIKVRSRGDGKFRYIEEFE